MKFEQIVLAILKVLLIIFETAYSGLRIASPVIIGLFALEFLFETPPQPLVIIVVLGFAGASMAFVHCHSSDLKIREQEK